jgi:hypothetical protein
MVFFLEITNIWQKSRDFWFVDFLLETFKIHCLLWIFCCFERVLSMFCLKLSLILNFKNAFLSKTTFRSIFESFDGVLRAKEIYRLGSMDSKICTLAKNV